MKRSFVNAFPRFASVGQAQILASFALVISGTAAATVDGYFNYYIVRSGIQTDDLCLQKMIGIGEFGIPQEVMTAATLSQSVVANVPAGRPIRYENINELATQPAIKHSYLDDSYDEATRTWSYAVKLDFAALSGANGQTVAGRTTTIRTAKLALLALSRNLADMSGGRYKLQVEFVGLPTQGELPGTKVYTTTSQPYTKGSPLLAAYEKELINTQGECE